MTDFLLMIMNPRKIDECVQSYHGLEVDKAWLVGYDENNLNVPVAKVVEETNYDYYVMVSDDVVITPRAFEAIRETASPDLVNTGWTNVDMTYEGVRMSSVIRTPFPNYDPKPVAADYDWIPIRQVVTGDQLRRTWFAGMCLTCMSRDMWLRFPFQTYGPHWGRSSDFELSWRLQEAGIPVYAVRDAGVFHVKEVTNQTDTEKRKALYFLGEDAHTRYEKDPNACSSSSPANTDAQPPSAVATS